MSANPIDKRAATAAGWALATLLATAASAQFPQYTQPGSLGEQARPTREVLEEGYSEARWRLGRLRVEPGFSVHELGYHDNVFADPEGMTVSDFTATVAAGLNGYLHLGPKVILAGFVRPQYVWWQDLEELRELTESYGAGVFGYFNRMTVTVEARTLEQQRQLNSETEAPVVVRRSGGAAKVEIEASDRVSIFGGLAATDYRHQADLAAVLPGLALAALDRDETIAEVGVSYEIGDDFEIGVGVERSDVEFALDPGGRSNSGTSPLLRFDFSGNRVSAEGTLVSRDLEFESAGERRAFDEVTGTVRWGLRLGARSRLSAYGGRFLVYSAFNQRGFLVQERSGLSLSRGLRERGRVWVFAEVGGDDFEGGGSEARSDDYDSFGAGLRLPLPGRIVLDLGVSRVRYDSNLEGFDRSANIVRSAVTLGGELFGW